MSQLRKSSSWKRAVLAFALGSFGALVFAQAAVAVHQAPVGASPLRVSLVPAFAQCVAGDQTHGGPLPFSDCSTAAGGATPESSMVIWGPSSIGFARLVACPTGGTGQCAPADPPNPAVNGEWAQPDIRVTASILDLRCGTPPNCATPGVSPYNPNPAASHYTTAGTSAQGPSPACFPAAPNPPGGANPTCGAPTADARLVATIPGSTAGNGVRITDHGNGPISDTGTTVDSPFPVPIDCGIPAPAGTNCGVNTAVNALVAGAVTDGRQGVIEVGQIELLDASGAPFAVQGIFSP